MEDDQNGRRPKWMCNFMIDWYFIVSSTYLYHTEFGHSDVAQFRSQQRLEYVCKQSFGPKKVQKYFF